MLGIDIIVGAVTGLIGSCVTGYTNYKTQKLKNEHDQMIIELETKAMIAEANANIRITEAKVEGEIELADTKAYIESQKHGNKQLFDTAWIERLWSGGMVAKFFGTCIAILFAGIDILKAIIRPGVTLYLVTLSTIATYMAWEIMQKTGVVISGSEAFALFDKMITMVTYLTISCVTWHFGDRAMSKFLMKLNK